MAILLIFDSPIPFHSDLPRLIEGDQFFLTRFPLLDLPDHLIPLFSSFDSLEPGQNRLGVTAIFRHHLHDHLQLERVFSGIEVKGIRQVIESFFDVESHQDVNGGPPRPWL